MQEKQFPKGNRLSAVPFHNNVCYAINNSLDINMQRNRSCFTAGNPRP